jgi:nucleoside-diphosphate-sugar epimerase
MKILITGSEGFVGQHLVADLKNKKHDVVEFDIATGQNILNNEHLKKYLNKVDVVIHLAAVIENKNPDLWKINVQGTKHLIKKSVEYKIKKFILLSSTGVYGFTKGLVDEKTPTNPENAYEKSKVEAEGLVLNHQEEIEVCVLRSAMILGPNKYWSRMFKVLRRGLPLPTNGKNTFQIIFVKELINALNLVMKKGDSGEIYLVAGKERLTLKSFCEEAKKQLGKNRKILTMPTYWALFIGKILRVKILTRENIRHLSKERRYDIKKIEALGFKQKHTLKDAIFETIEEIKQMDL